MEVKAKLLISFFILLVLVMNATAQLDTENLEVGEIKLNRGGAIEKYHYEPGLYCRGNYTHSGCKLKNPTPENCGASQKNPQKYEKSDCVFLKNFTATLYRVFGQAIEVNNDWWYVIDHNQPNQEREKIMVSSLEYLAGLGDLNFENEAGKEFVLNYAKKHLGEEAITSKENLEEAALFALIYAKKNLGEEALGTHLLFLAENSGSFKPNHSDAYKALKKRYPAKVDLLAKVDELESSETKLKTHVDELKNSEMSLKTQVDELKSSKTKLTTQVDKFEKSQRTTDYYWYIILILGFLLLVLLAVIVHMSTVQGSNINRKFNVGDRVKVRNKKKQEWRTGVVKQSLKVEVDGWQNALIWNHVEHIKPFSENTHSHTVEENSKTNENELSKNTAEKESEAKSTKNITEEIDKKVIRTKSSSKNESHESNEFDEETSSNSMNHTTEDKTMTPSEIITEPEETNSVDTMTDESEKNLHSNSEASTSRT